MRVTLSIVGKTLFDTDVESKADHVGVAVTEVLETFWFNLLPFQSLIDRLPIPVLRRARAARARLDALIYGMIAERRAVGGDRGDLLSMLIAAQDDEADGGKGLTDLQVRDEAMTLLLAGHETTANALTWTWYLLSQYAGRRGAAARGARSRARRPASRRSPTCRVCRWSSASSPSRCGCIRRRGWSAGAPSPTTPSATTWCPRAR